MSSKLILFPLLLGASPAVAQAAPVANPDAAREMSQVLNDPAMADRLANMMQGLSKAFLDLPAGEIQAAAEGRQPTPAERRMTVRDMARRDDPNFDRNFQQRIAQTKPMIQQSMRALSQALPAMMDGLQQAGKALERAAANMPDPTYPKR
ncbi:MAG TPA: hypothetical protein VF757_00275 [Sphingomicrobium sp.]